MKRSPQHDSDITLPPVERWPTGPDWRVKAKRSPQDDSSSSDSSSDGNVNPFADEQPACPDLMGHHGWKRQADPDCANQLPPMNTYPGVGGIPKEKRSLQDASSGDSSSDDNPANDFVDLYANEQPACPDFTEVLTGIVGGGHQWKRQANPDCADKLGPQFLGTEGAEKRAVKAA